MTNHTETPAPATTVGGNRYDERSALLAHGIDADLGLDYVRNEAHVLSVCLGCASIVTAPDATTWGAMRDLIDWDAADCCPDADRVNY